MYRIHGVVMVMLQVNNNGGSWLLDPSCSGGPRRTGGRLPFCEL